MALIFGLDISATSIGFAVIDHDPEHDKGKIHRLGVRVFPEARDPKGTPLNQERRQARLRRRQLRRRRERRRVLQDLLCRAGLLPGQNSLDWNRVMKSDPYVIRRRAFEGQALEPYEIGRAIYHLAQRRHFKGRDIDQISDVAEPGSDDEDDRQAMSARLETAQILKREGKTLGAWLSQRGPHERKRGLHATRRVVEEEFQKVWAPLLPEALRKSVGDAIFCQRPVFWRWNTLGRCRFVPGAPLCPRGSWLSQQKRMLETLNNLSLTWNEQRPLDAEERQAILARLQTQASMTWGGARKALAPLYRARGKAGAEKRLKFNLEERKERHLPGNMVEAKLAAIFASAWPEHPQRQAIRDAVHERIWRADYGEVGRQRVIILPAAQRARRRREVARYFSSEFGASQDQAARIAALKLPAGWEPFSVAALRAILPHLEAGVRFAAIVSDPDWQEWRDRTFSEREQSANDVRERLPSPADPEENRHVSRLRNPTIARIRNELRKVVNNLISMFGKPDLIRVELAWEVGRSKRQRDRKALDFHRQDRLRAQARQGIEAKGIAQPSRDDIEKWLLWKECGERCPYTGDCIFFDALFRTGEFQVEHIWPRSRAPFDSNNFSNKTLCRRDVNISKGNKIPFEYFGHDPQVWQAIVKRLRDMNGAGKGIGMSPGKVKRFLAREIPDDFTSRQLNDNGHAAREVVACLKRLWPAPGPEMPVQVQAISSRVVAHLRRLWGLNGVLSDAGSEIHADHRRHAVDALTIACCHPGVAQKLACYWQARDDPHSSTVPYPRLTAPWETIRTDAESAVAGIVVSHRVRRKVSGRLHKETVCGDTGREERTKRATYRYFVTRKNVAELSVKEIDDIVDIKVQKIVRRWVADNGGSPKKAFVDGYPGRGRKGPEIRRVRLYRKRQISVMARSSTGYADLGKYHHVAIYQLRDGAVDYKVVSLLEASRRLAQGKPIVCRQRDDNAQFLMSLSPGDALLFAKDGKQKVRVVDGVWEGGRIVLVDHDDAKGTTRFRRNARTIVAGGARKLSIDPIGRIRSAND